MSDEPGTGQANGTGGFGGKHSSHCALLCGSFKARVSVCLVGLLRLLLDR